MTAWPHPCLRSLKWMQASASVTRTTSARSSSGWSAYRASRALPAKAQMVWSSASNAGQAKTTYVNSSPSVIALAWTCGSSRSSRPIRTEAGSAIPRSIGIGPSLATDRCPLVGRVPTAIFNPKQTSTAVYAPDTHRQQIEGDRPSVGVWAMTMSQRTGGSASIFACFSVILALTVPAGAATPSALGKVWHWYARCAQPRRVEMEVTFGRRQVYSSVFDVCLLERDAIDPEQPQRILKFNLVSSHRSLFGERQGEPLEGNVWEAGNDGGDLVLGVSFAGRRRVWCNSLHVLDPEKISETPLARGLLVRTTPSG